VTAGPRTQQWVGGRVVTPDGVLSPGWLHAVDGRILEVGAGDPPPLPTDEETERHDLAGRWLLPGFVDLHMHGGGGHDVTGSPAELLKAVSFHTGHGTTSTLISLVTAPVKELVRQLGWIADVTRQEAGSHGRVLGAHLEGPFLSPQRCGAQNVQHMRAPERQLFARLIGAADGTLRSMTLAPELPGALDLVQDAISAGVVASLGHSDATYAAASAAIDAGASLATHLFNGMRPLHHREPGLIGAALASGIAVELINDGIHVHPAHTRVLAG
jgi:N-acetylglucosamine-6-phosphate deacetylase